MERAVNIVHGCLKKQKYNIITYTLSSYASSRTLALAPVQTQSYAAMNHIAGKAITKLLCTAPKPRPPILSDLLAICSRYPRHYTV